ncbi:MAG: thioredoxin domain-containing protein [Akkermansiaceae bacterium]
MAKKTENAARGDGAMTNGRNHLSGEKSPYLIQHAGNPVDWYPWSEAAFAKAREENKPILLSIGYSTCHWCHVMERESFENEEVAQYLNEHFISIKVDREERPDVDKIYMTAYQAMYQGGGGWPLNMFVTPELKPFSGGTYFPPHDRQGRAGFVTVLKTIHSAWSEQGAEVIGSADQIHQKMQRVFERVEVVEGQFVAKDLNHAASKLVAEADTQFGGWGGAPKFPQVSHLRFLLRHWHRTGDMPSRNHVLLTAEQMMQAGIHDQLAGGFHRYSVDERWMVPHFEKMLYDQAQLLELYLDVWLVTKDERYRHVAMGVANYVTSEMQHYEGGFYSAQDAQSEGKEGKCFCWTLQQMEELLDEDELVLAKEWFGVSAEGNFIDHSDPEPLMNLNVIHLARPDWELTFEQRTLINSATLKMRNARVARIPAETDRKVLADWNGMMIASLARASHVLDQPSYLEAAVRAHTFICNQLWDGELLYHRWCDGERDHSQQASSYLHMMAGSLGLYQATLEARYLDFAIKLAEGACSIFYDELGGGFYVGAERSDLVLRLKDDFDGALPTASSVGAMVYLKLAEITGRGDFREVVDKTLSTTAEAMKTSPYTMPWMMSVADMQLGQHARLVITQGDGREALIAACGQVFCPRLICMGGDGHVDAFSSALQAIDGKSAAYYCKDQTCQEPRCSAESLIDLLAH